MLLDGLPSMGSHYMAARREDPEFAEWLAGQPELTQQRWKPRSAEWTLEHELLAGFFDRLGDWMTQYANSNRGKGQPAVRPPQRYPRPVTAIERAKARAEARFESALENLIVAAHATYAAEHEGKEG